MNGQEGGTPTNVSRAVGTFRDLLISSHPLSLWGRTYLGFYRPLSLGSAGIEPGFQPDSASAGTLFYEIGPSTTRRARRVFPPEGALKRFPQYVPRFHVSGETHVQGPRSGACRFGFNTRFFFFFFFKSFISRSRYLRTTQGISGWLSSAQLFEETRRRNGEMREKGEKSRVAWGRRTNDQALSSQERRNKQAVAEKWRVSGGLEA